jgi:DMSO/TMAO reductase YedYZ molybdopterin-dependent catalytic subunit
MFSPGGMIVREREPMNLEMPFGTLDAFITPSDRFFVRNHFSIPRIDVKTWRLKIEGEVERPFELTYDQVREMEPRSISVTMECAGNGRAFLTPSVSGAQWERGAVSNAEWTGVLLAEVLRRAGLKNSVREVIFEGADRGEIKEPSGPAGESHYARSLPLKKANEDVLLAFKMNGEELTPAHGAPLRLIVPGWYGMASVKWLTRIIASAHPFHGYYQTMDYAYWERGPSARTLVPVTEMQVKAQIARPGFADAVRAGETYHVRGAAWTSGAEITKVEISTDGGETWHHTRLLGESTRNAWRLWEYDWKVPEKPGKATLMARATDSEGRTQPTERDLDRRSYIVNHLLPIEVDVRCTNETEPSHEPAEAQDPSD